MNPKAFRPPSFPLLLGLILVSTSPNQAAEPARSMRFQATTEAEALAWQKAARSKLFALMMGGQEPARGPLKPMVLRRIEVPEGGYVLEELTLQTLPDRRAHVWLARPIQPKGRVGGVLAINGHGGSGEQIVHGTSLYWYGRALAEMGYVVIAPDVGQHELQHPSWSLMGERTWDALRSLDYLATLPEVDPDRLAVAGLSLGGETTMYVAALDERLKLACSSGWLTTVANMKNGHCECFNFPGLEEHFDFADIFACVAPRPLICELGEKETAPGGFPVSIGRQALEEILAAYRVFKATPNAILTVHPGPHVFSGRDFLPKVRETLGSPRRPVPDPAATAAWIRFTEGPESLDGTPYHWLGRTAIQVTFEVRPQPGDALELAWGAKSDHRLAVLRINGQDVTVQDGGHWGFRWLRVPIPPGIAGESYVIDIAPGQGLPAFLSEIRLVSATPSGPPLDLSVPRANVGLLLKPLAAAGPGAEAFPDMRRVWDREPPAPSANQPEARTDWLFRLADKNARLAHEAFFRCRRFVDGWLAQADPATGLIPRNLRESRDFWNGRDSAADNYPYMVLTAAMTDRALLHGRLLDMLRMESRLTSRVGRLPDDYSFSKQGWRREKLDLDAIIFDGAEYVKDGLLPITEWLGPSPWSERMIGMIDDIWAHAAVETPFGRIPTLNFEVGGDLMQANARLFWFTGERKYLELATRLSDFYLLGTNHPTRDMSRLRLIDHGCEVVNGLTEVYFAVAHAWPEKREAYRPPLQEMFNCILAKGRNPDGLLYAWFNPQTGEHSPGLCDTWGYDYDGFYTMWQLDGVTAYRDAVLQTLGNLRGRYEGAWYTETSADAYADSIEGALNLINREPVASAEAWVDSQIRLMWAIQKPDGIIEGWHGDGNFARTSLMYALWKTRGMTLEPWREDLRLGAVQDGAALHLHVTADQAWEGRLVFDRPRHKQFMRLPWDYPRINQFPEWFTVEAQTDYAVQPVPGTTLERTGAQLGDGLLVKLGAGETLRLTVTRK